MRFCAAFTLVAIVVAFVVATIVGTTGAALSTPWVLGPPIAVVAALLSVWRTRATGESVGIAAAGVGGLQLVGPATGAAVVLTLALCAVAGTRREVVVGHGVVHGLGGELVLARGADLPGVRLDAAGRLEECSPVVVAADLPVGFTPLPQGAGRLRRELFVTVSPLGATDHPLDPTAWRWALLTTAWLAVAGILLRSR